MKDDVIDMVGYIENLEYEKTDALKLARIADTVLKLLSELIPDKDLDTFEISECIDRLTLTIHRYLKPAVISPTFSSDQFEEIRRNLLNDLRLFGIIDLSNEAASPYVTGLSRN